jgi:GxxExxY protein
MEHGDLTEKIIGGAFGVYRELAFGFLESVYENSLVIELAKHELSVESRRLRE